MEGTGETVVLGGATAGEVAGVVGGGLVKAGERTAELELAAGSDAIGDAMGRGDDGGV